MHTEDEGILPISFICENVRKDDNPLLRGHKGLTIYASYKMRWRPGGMCSRAKQDCCAERMS